MTQWFLANFLLGAIYAALWLHLGAVALARLHPGGHPVTLGDLILRSLAGDR
jgi:hypothetical protein